MIAKLTAKLNLVGLTKIFAIFLFMCVVAPCLMTDIVSADVDNTAHWSVQVTSNWNAIYGQVTGISLEDGDSVGMFDTEGNCYGAGLVRGGYYFLSAFAWEEADSAKPNDFTIPGFKNGNVVIFKAYRGSRGEEYVLVPSNGESYCYTYIGNYPPERIDLVYDEEDDSPPSSPAEEASSPQEGTTSSPSGRTLAPIYGGVVKESEKLDQGKTEEIEPDKIREPLSPERSEEVVNVDKEAKRPGRGDSYETYEPTEPKRVISSKYSLSQKEDKETIAKDEIVLAQAPLSKSEVIPEPIKEEHVKDEPIKKSFSLFTTIILMCAIFVLVKVFIKESRKAKGL